MRKPPTTQFARARRETPLYTGRLKQLNSVPFHLCCTELLPRTGLWCITMKVVLIILVISVGFVGIWGHKARPKKRSHGEEIHFQTKVKDVCIMNISGNGDVQLRIECKSRGKTYWCEYTGKPSMCRPFNNNPRTYWNQIVMELRKRINACHSNLILKPTMCLKAPSEAHMKQVSSNIKTNPNPMQPADLTQVKMVTKPLASAKQAKESQAGRSSLKKLGKPKSSPLLPIKPTHQGQLSEHDSEAMKLAREHCWESLHEVCSYIISFFRG